MKKFAQRIAVVSLLSAALLTAGGRWAEARLFGNPATDLGKGNMDVGLGLSTVSKELNEKVPIPQICVPSLPTPICVGGGTASGSSTESVNHTTIFFDYGLADKGTIRAAVSQAKYGIASASGTEFGVDYRQNFSTRTLSGGKVLTLAGLAGYESGSLSGGQFLSGSYSEFQIAFGGSLAVQKELNVYAAAVYDNLDGSLSSSGLKVTFSSKDPIGIYGGAGYQVTPEFKIGGEYHLIFETGWAIYGTFKF